MEFPDSPPPPQQLLIRHNLSLFDINQKCGLVSSSAGDEIPFEAMLINNRLLPTHSSEFLLSEH